MPQVSQSRTPTGASPVISVVFAYYENPSMLELQWKEIADYPALVKKSLEVIVVDDGSPCSPAGEVPDRKSVV